MSYYDDSSLFVAPNGYKTSVLFAQKPMDANGQLAFTRSNDTATRVGPDGLIEKVRTNLILQSNTFSNASWTNNTLVTANNQISPDGTLDASTFTSDGAYHGVLQSLTITSVPHTFSIYAKAGNYSIFRIVNVSSLTNVAWFNLSTGVTSGAIGGTSKIEAVGNGWFRCSYSTNSPNTSTTNQGFVLSDAMGSLGGVPSGSTMYFWKSQIETGDIATDTITTLGTAVSVGPVANLPRIDYTGGGCGKLLLEPQRTNLVTYSENFNNAAWTKSNASVTANAATSPDGYTNADKIVENTATSGHSTFQSISATSGATYTISAFGKAAERTRLWLDLYGGTNSANFDLSNGTILASSVGITAKIENYGNGWYRCSITGVAPAATIYPNVGPTTTSTTTNLYTGDGTSGILIYGFQLELASYATSYIGPTLGSASTRGADSCIKTGISSLIGQSEGTLFAEFKLNKVNLPNNHTWIAIKDLSQNNRILIYMLANQTTLRGQIKHSGTAYNLGFGTITDNQNIKIAFAYKSGDSAVYINGSSVATDTNTLTFGTMDIFDFNDSGLSLDGEINQALLFKTRLSNSELASLTTL
jgi:hypothetical protein